LPPVVSALVVYKSNIIAGTYDGVYISTNNGSSWSAVNTGLPVIKEVISLAISDSNISCK
jgi:ligand-binding sensor domain-containing protein